MTRPNAAPPPTSVPRMYSVRKPGADALPQAPVGVQGGHEDEGDVARAHDSRCDRDRELGGGQVQVHGDWPGLLRKWLTTSATVAHSPSDGGAERPSAHDVRPVVGAQVDAGQADHRGDGHGTPTNAARLASPGSARATTTATPIQSVE